MRLAHDAATGLYYRKDTNDRTIIREALANYEKLPIGAGDVLLDLGAHIGTCSRMALASGASAVALEADPTTIGVLRRNLREPNARAIWAAVGPRAGIVRFYTRADRPQTGTLIANDEGRKSTQVPMLAFRDLLLLYKPTIVKCDIEFGEYDLPELRALPSHVRTLALEVHVRYDLVFAHLEQTPDELRDRRAQAAGLIRAIEAQGFREVTRSTKSARGGSSIEDDTGLGPRVKSIDAIWTR